MSKVMLKRIYGEISKFDVETSNYVLEIKDELYNLSLIHI